MPLPFHRGFVRNKKCDQMFNSRRFLSAVERNGSGTKETRLSKTCTGRWIYERNLLKQILLSRFSLN